MTGAENVSRVHERAPGASGGARAPRIDRLVLLAGAVRPSDLTRQTGRSVLELPITAHRALLGQWSEQAARLARWLGVDGVDVDVVLDPSTDAPRVGRPDEGVRMHLRRDETDYRGTGGALRDIAATMGDGGVLLVANAGQILTVGLDEVAARLASAGGDVALVAHEDGTPSGVMLLPTRTLGGVKPVGFVDFKEQVLPTLRDAFDIRVVRFDRATGHPVRTRESYIAALRAHHDRERPGAPIDDFAERWAPTFGIAEPGSDVDASARLHDSVVLGGGRVEAGAVVVRSVVGPRGRIGRGRIVVDSVVAGEPGRRLGRSA